MTKTCEFELCGKEYTADRYNGEKQRFCSPRCKRYYFNVASGTTSLETARNVYTGSRTTLTCEVCLKAFTVTSAIGNPKYCSDTCRTREQILKNTYGITSVIYYAMLRKQNGLCAICSQPSPDIKLHIDHNHTTGKVRALLCRRCNALFGWYEAYKSQIAEYDEEHNGNNAHAS
jgi:hypothetical protein